MAYTRLLRLYYRTERPIPADIGDACRLTRAKTKDERKAVETILREFFTLESDGWHNPRADQEIEKYKAKASANRENGKAGGRPKRTEEEPKNNPDGFNSLTQKNLNQNQNQNQNQLKEKTDKPGANAPVDPCAKVFSEGVELLTASGDSERNARSYLGKLRRDHGDEAVLSALQRAKDGAVSDPKGFLAGALRPKGARLAL